jgi:hypothetical protein
MKRQRMLVTVLAAVGLMVGATACGPKHVTLPDVPATVTPAVDGAEQDVYAAAVKALRISKAAGDTLVGIATTEVQLNAQGVIPPGVHAGLKTAIEDAAQALHVLNEKIRAGVHDWATLRSLLETALAPVQSLIDQVTRIADQATRTKWGQAVSSIAADLAGLLPGGVR